MTLTALEAKERFDEALETARHQLVTITQEGRPVAALISIEEYECLRRRDDAYWGQRALDARKSGYLGVEETMRFLLAGMEGDDDDADSSLETQFDDKR